MSISFFVTGLLFSVALGAPQGCIWTDTNCACSKKKDIVVSQTCWDPIPPVVPVGQNQPCTDRECNLGGKVTQYVCDCNGASYCGFTSTDRVTLTPISQGMCSSKRVSSKVVVLVEDDIKKVHGLKQSTGKCIFSKDECTCAQPSEKHDCIDFVVNDPRYGNTCNVRDCKDSMVCDCGGNATCAKRTVTKMVWKSTGNIPGRPGMVTCKRESATFVQVTPKIMSSTSTVA
jgi:hypothetical protein